MIACILHYIIAVGMLLPLIPIPPPVRGINQGVSNYNLTGVSTCPLNESTFVMAYQDQTNSRIAFQILSTKNVSADPTNYTILPETVVASFTYNANFNYTGIGVASFNSSHFVIAWWDNGTSVSRVYFEVWNTTGLNPNNIITVDANAGLTGCVQVSCLNSTHFVVGWMSGTGPTAKAAVYMANTTKWGSDITIASSLGGYSFCSVSCFNSTRFVMGYYFAAGAPSVNASVYDIDTGSAVRKAYFTVDSSVGTSRGICVSCLNSTHFLISWLYQTSYYQKIGVYTSSGVNVNNKVFPKIIDTVASSSTIPSYSSRCTALSETEYAVTWYSTNAAHYDLHFYTGQSDGTLLSSGDVESWPTVDNPPFRDNCPSSYEAAVGVAIYNCNWVVAYANTTSQACAKTYTETGNLWDGTVVIPPPWETTTCYVNGAGTYQQCYIFPNNGSSHYIFVKTDDQDASYIYGDAATINPGTGDGGMNDTDTIDSSLIPVGSTINNMTVLSVCRSNSTTTARKASFANLLKNSTGVYEGTLGTPSTTYVTYSTMYSGITSSELATLEIGVHIESPNPSYPGRSTQVYCIINYTQPYKPTYNNISSGPTCVFGGQSMWFHGNFSTALPSSTIDKVVLNTNNTGAWANTTWTSAGQADFEWNVTITVNVTGNCDISWYFYFNCTVQGGPANQTGIYTSSIIKFIPTYNPHEFGYTQGSTNGEVYYKGNHSVVYVAYQNSSFTYWHQQICAYDINTSMWYGPYDVWTTNPGTIVRWNDGHSAPALGVTSDGYLFYCAGDGSPLYYRLSTYSANTQPDTATLISSWGSTRTINGTGPANTFVYPRPLSFSDKLWICGRTDNGSSPYEDFNVLNVSQKMTVFVNYNDSAYTTLTTFGSQPYLDDGDTSGINRTAGTNIGWFYFDNSSYTQNILSETNMNTTLGIYGIKSGTSYETYRIWLNVGGSDIDLGTDAAVNGWASFDITSYVDTLAKLNNTKIRLQWTSGGGSGSFNVTRANMTVQYYGWAGAQQLCNTEYPYFEKSGSTYILMASPNESQCNMYFAYSSDEGVTWKYANGTSLSTPINVNSCWVADSPAQTRPVTPILDQNNQPSFLSVVNTGGYSQTWDGDYAVLTYYNNSVGSAGTWFITNATDIYGNLLHLASSGVAYILDPWFNQPSFYTSQDGFICKYVRVPNNYTAFYCVWNETGSPDSLTVNFLVRNAQVTYDTLSSEWRTAVGNITQGATETTATTTEFWACQYTCTRTGELTGVRIFANDSVGASLWRVAVFDTSYQKLSSNPDGYYLTTASTGYGWLLTASFSPTVTVTQGTTYWIGYRFSHSVGFKWNPSTTVNQTLRYTYGTFSSDFPASFTPTDFYNYTVTVAAIQTTILVYGVGASYGTITTNTTQVNDTCLFNVPWYSPFGANLEGFTFGCNITGVMVNETYNTDSELGWGTPTANGTQTKFMNGSGSFTLQWQEWCTDTNKNNATTGLQLLYLTYGLNLTYTQSDILGGLGSVLESLEKGWTNTELLGLLSSLLMGREVAYLGSGTVGLLSNSVWGLSKQFANSGIIGLLGSVVSGIETAFTKSGILGLLGINGLGVEKGFPLSGTAGLLGQNLFGLEHGFPFAGILGLLGTGTMSTGLEFPVYEYASSGVMGLIGSVKVGLEKGFAASSQTGILGLNLFAHETGFFKSGIAGLIGTNNVAWELVYAVYEWSVSGTVGLWHDLGAWLNGVTSLYPATSPPVPPVPLDQATMIALFGVVLAMLAFALALTKKREESETH